MTGLRVIEGGASGPRRQASPARPPNAEARAETGETFSELVAAYAGLNRKAAPILAFEKLNLEVTDRLDAVRARMDRLEPQTAGDCHLLIAMAISEFEEVTDHPLTFLDGLRRWKEALGKVLDWLEAEQGVDPRHCGSAGYFCGARDERERYDAPEFEEAIDRAVAGDFLEDGQ